MMPNESKAQDHGQGEDPIILGPPTQPDQRLSYDEPAPEPAPEPESVPAYVPPRFAGTSVIPRRVLEVTAPDPYENFKVKLWVNPSDLEINARVTSTRNMGEFMTHFIVEWTLVDEQGEPLPVTFEAIQMLPKDLWDWLTNEFGEARNRPLAPPKNDTTTKNQTPTRMNPNRSPSLNGSTG